MKMKLLIAAFAAAFAAPVYSGTVDFTTSAINVATPTGSLNGIGFTVTSFGGDLVDARHKTDVGCGAFDCHDYGSGSRPYDVGFGVRGGNNNEVDGIRRNEYVQVTFESLIELTGFAGMLTYSDNTSRTATETVILKGTTNGTDYFDLGIANPNNAKQDGPGSGSFNTVGLATGFFAPTEVIAVRFLAGGTSPFDDGNTNITAAGLQAVPVPAALPLLLVGVGALGFAARKRKS